MADSTRRTLALSGKRRALLEALLPEAGAGSGVMPISQRSAGETAPLSFAQRGLWFLHQIDPASPSYHVPCVGRLRGPLQPAVLERSLGELIRRHEILRTTIAPGTDGEPGQRVSPPGAITLPVVELGDGPATDRERRVQQLVTEQYEPPFDLTRGPLWRGQLLRLSETEHLLVLIFHHLVFDGWSDGVLWRELAAGYDGFLREQPVALPPLAIQYADFAAWQRQWLTGDVLAQQLDFWKKQLGGELPTLTLPSDRSRSQLPEGRAGRVSLALPAGLSEAVRQLSQAAGTTLFMTLLAGFQTLLHRCTGQDDLAVGSPLAGRNRRETEALIGFFVNLVVFRGNLSGEPTFRELLRRTRDLALEAFAHQDLPFEKLVEELRPERDLRRNPLAPVVFLFQSQTPARPFAAGLELTPESFPFAAAKFDLTLEVTDASGELRCAVDYNTELFDAATMARMLGHYQVLLEGVVANPDARLGELPLLTFTERRQLLEEWNDTAVDYPRDVCLHHLLAAQVERTPEAVAVTFGAASLTYRELDRRANQLAQHLVQRGVGPDVLVGICVERSLEMVVGLLGILKAGGAYVPLDPDYPPDRLAFMLADANVPVLLTQERLLGKLPPLQAARICLDRDWPGIAQANDTPPVTAVDAGHLAYMIYTSGSTGKPKGALNAHRGIVNRLLWMQDEYHLTVADSVLQKTPFSFDVSVWEFFWPLLTGARLVVAAPGGHQDAAYLVNLIAAQNITVLHFVPPMLRVFLEEPGLERCRSLRHVICSGEALPYDLQENFFARMATTELHNLYGPTEAAVDVTYWACQRQSERQCVPIGRPVANTQTYILDARLQPVPVGVPGELHLGGVQIGRGYHNRPELTREKFIADPFRHEPGARLYRTGDLCRHLADGAIEYLGRLDHQVKIRGFRIELGEIEAVIAQHPNVKEVVVVAREETPGNKRLVAYVGATGTAPAVGELRSHLKERLPDYMVPAAFVFLEKFPLTANGKVDRKALPAPETARVETAATYEAPRTATEIALAAIWCDVLRLPQVGRHDNFFELGGHSLLALRILARAREIVGVEVTLRTLFEQPTVAGLAKQVEIVRPWHRPPDSQAEAVPAGHEAGEI